jgi:hypothetical protein
MLKKTELATNTSLISINFQKDKLDLIWKFRFFKNNFIWREYIFIPKNRKKKKKWITFLTFLHPILPKYSEIKFNALFGIQVKIAFSLLGVFSNNRSTPSFSNTLFF